MESLAPTNFFFPSLNAILNGASGVLLIWGWWAIKRSGRPASPRDRELHKKVMLVSFAVSVAFLASYLYYHFNYASVRYQGTPMMRAVYLAVLIPHVLLATLNLPFILRTIYLALKGRYTEHARLARWVWPIWTYVSITGVLVYLMLYIWVDPSIAPQPTPSISDLIPKSGEVSK
ncbi:MAG: DUF420 domain-containing protein [Bdellovibrionota bacterium]